MSDESCWRRGAPLGTLIAAKAHLGHPQRRRAPAQHPLAIASAFDPSRPVIGSEKQLSLRLGEDRLARTDHAKLNVSDPFAPEIYHADGNGNVTALIYTNTTLTTRVRLFLEATQINLPCPQIRA